MHSDEDGQGPRQGGERASLYALVIYLPEPLCGFLDRLRLEMVPGCNPHAHVSVLPPRPVPVAPEAAIEAAGKVVAGFAPFEIELGEIEKFDATDVVYISVGDGAQTLREMHRSLNRGVLAFDEPFQYHPHITLAQDIGPEHIEPLRELALRRWSEFRGPRRFRAQSAVFVRNASDNCWVDLAVEPLRAQAVR